MSYLEKDTRKYLINPQLKSSGWNSQNIIEEYVITLGKIKEQSVKQDILKADYILHYKNSFLAIVEAKQEVKDYREGLQQAIQYAEKLNIHFAYATNGHKIYEHNLRTGQGQEVSCFPTPEELYQRCFEQSQSLKINLLQQPFYLESNLRPRYYQYVAVNKTLEAIAEQQKRILLTLATGTGKTFIAFQIVYRLFQAYWNLSNTPRRPRIMFLADRNILADQAMNTFNPLEADIVRINGKEIKKRNGQVPKNAFIFFAIYQAIADRQIGDDENEDVLSYYKQYEPDFFDAIIIDECHRGSANDKGSWRQVLDYFDSSVHIGLTATPKQDDNVDTYDYFGKPIYEYSLNEGINDGFLTPYKIKRIETWIDDYVINQNDKIIQGNPDKQYYELTDFEKQIVIPERTEFIAQVILQQINPMDKTIIFCVNQQHALDMRIAIDKFKTISANNYCVRVTSDEKEIGRKFLEDFQNNDKPLPVILTSSNMLTTGVDARNVRNIVLLKNINSIVEFKQIIGRGTRLYEDKLFFTIIDFNGATDLFYDSRWDGEPIEIQKEKVSKETHKENNKKSDENLDEVNSEEKPKKEKLIVSLSDDRQLKIKEIKTFYLGKNEKPLSTQAFLEYLVGSIAKYYDNELALRTAWANPKTRNQVLQQLQHEDIETSQLLELKTLLHAEHIDLYDVLAHICFNSKLYTRAERVAFAKNHELFKTINHQKLIALLNFVLEQYEKYDFTELAEDKLPDLIRLSGVGSPRDIANELPQGINQIKHSYIELQQSLMNV